MLAIPGSSEKQETEKLEEISGGSNLLSDQGRFWYNNIIFVRKVPGIGTDLHAQKQEVGFQSSSIESGVNPSIHR